MSCATQEQNQECCQAIAKIIPKGTGFIIFTFPTEGQEGLLWYGSNSDHRDCLNVLKEWMIKCGHQEDWMKNV